eukprot:COSAG05_NODE_52_length_23775_cov_49.471110_7_plen_133_part_00
MTVALTLPEERLPRITFDPTASVLMGLRGFQESIKQADPEFVRAKIAEVQAVMAQRCASSNSRFRSMRACNAASPGSSNSSSSSSSSSSSNAEGQWTSTWTDDAQQQKRWRRRRRRRRAKMKQETTSAHSGP